MRTIRALLLVGTAMVPMWGATANAQQPSETAPVSENAAETEAGTEIVVTAQKRAQNLEDVPISIAVLSGEQLDQSSVPNVQEALRSVAAVDFRQTGGYTGGSMISLRGVANGIYREGGGSTVAYYVDGTPYGLIRSAIVPLDADPFDLERVEVLRGPQGTLYGASALNGVIRVLTHDADTDIFEAKSRAFLSNTDDGGWNYGGNLALNVPLIRDRLAVRGVIGYRRDSGWIDSPIDNNDNTSKVQSFRLKFRAEPTETLVINLSAWHSKSERGAPSLSDDDKRITSVQDQSGSIKYTIFGAEVIKSFDAFTVNSMTSYAKFTNLGRFDGTPVGAPVVLDTDLRSKIFTEELNVVSNNEGPWRWSVGAYYRNAQDDTLQLFDWLPPLEAILGDTTTSNDYRDKSKSLAIYGEIGRRFLNDELELAAGLRYFRDKQSLQILSPYVPLPLTPIRSTAKAVTPRVVATWFPTKRNTFYASYSQGFRSGVIQAPNVQANSNFPAAKPDKIHNFEVGAKGALMSGRLSYEGAVYYLKWDDAQQTAVVPVVFNPDGTPTVFATAVVNAASASGFGAEGALTFRAAEGLELGANLSWNGVTVDEEIVENAASGPRVILPEGSRLIASPKITAGAFANYSFPIGSDGLRGNVLISGSYKSRQLFNSLTAGSWVPRYGNNRFDGGRVSFGVEAPNRWAARLFVDNVTNEYRSTEPRGLGSTAANREWLERPRPRTIGAQFEFSY